MKVLFDTSVLVASLVAKHPHHGRAMAVVERVLQRRDVAVVAAHALTETYSVLTRIPVSPRIGTETAHQLIRDNILAHCEVIALTAREHQRVLTTLARLSISGGASYDAIHAACAQKASVERLYTFNVRDFQLVAPELDSKIVAP